MIIWKKGTGNEEKTGEEEAGNTAADQRGTADEFMTKGFEDNVECTELVLRIVMDKDDLKVKSARTQYTVKNLQGRSVRLDIFADDSMD